jgi:YCII-related domain
MPRFMVLYVGLPTPPDASHAGWPEWFDKLGDRLVDRGSPLTTGLALHADGSTSGSATHLNGYSIIQAEDSNQALGLVQDHPYLAQGRGYSIEAYRLP